MKIDRLKERLLYDRQGKKRSAIAIILLLILFLFNSSIVVTGVVILVIHIIQLVDPSADHVPVANRPDTSTVSSVSSAIDGTYQYKSTSEILNELKAKQLNGDVTVLPAATFPSGTKGSAGSCLIQTDKTSMVAIQAEISVNGQVIATTPMMKPGQYVKSVSLSTDVPAGTYSATVYLNCYDLTTKKFLAKHDVDITVTVK